MQSPTHMTKARFKRMLLEAYTEEQGGPAATAYSPDTVLADMENENTNTSFTWTYDPDAGTFAAATSIAAAD